MEGLKNQPTKQEHSTYDQKMHQESKQNLLNGEMNIPQFFFFSEYIFGPKR